jgi:hypothetical protein
MEWIGSRRVQLWEACSKAGDEMAKRYISFNMRHGNWKTPAELIVRGCDRRLCGLVFHVDSIWSRTVNALKVSSVFLVYEVKKHCSERRSENELTKQREMEMGEPESPCNGKVATVIVPQSPCNMIAIATITRVKGGMSVTYKVFKKLESQIASFLKLWDIGNICMVIVIGCRIGNVKVFWGT